VLRSVSFFLAAFAVSLVPSMARAEGVPVPLPKPAAVMMVAAIATPTALPNLRRLEAFCKIVGDLLPGQGET